MTKPIIIYVRPAGGGIAEYAKRIEAIYRQQGFEVQPIVVGPTDNLDRLLTQVEITPNALYHFEVGAGDGRIFQASRQLLAQTQKPQLMTIHDPGVVVWHPITVKLADSNFPLLALVGKVVRKLATKIAGPNKINRHLANPLLTKIYLRPDYTRSSQSYYLPQPTYHEAMPKPRSHTKTPKIIGYAGFWGRGKGLETLIEAWQMWPNPDHVRLVVADGSARPNDSYAIALRQRLQRLNPPPELPGLLGGDQKLDDFLIGLDVLVLPYWPELPSGTSAMAMRAAELGVPIIASNIPALREQLGPEGAIYVEPKNSAALQQALARLNVEWNEIQTRAKATQKHIYTSHSWKAVGEQLSTIVAAVRGGVS